MPIQKLTKEEIIKKSITVFREMGYYRTSMSDLATFCGLTKGAFYHHFKNKEEVMIKSLEMTSNWFKKNVFSIAYNEAIPNDDKLENMLDLYQKILFHEKGGCIFGNTILETMMVESTFKESAQDFFFVWKESLIEIFKNKYPTTTAQEKSTQVITNLQGAIILMILNDEPQYLKDAIVRSKALY